MFEETTTMSAITGKIYAITGGNSGIGHATAQALVAGGASVAILGRDQERLAATQAELGEASLAVQGDVTRSDDLRRFSAAIAERFGALDGLFVNAGAALFAPLDALTEEQIHGLLAVNVVGAVSTVQHALPLLRHGAAIVLNSSMLADMGVPGASIYAASKAAVASLARSLSAELLGRGIRVNTVSPGNIRTPLYDRLGMPREQRDAALAAELAQIPLGRFGSAEEIARAVVFLLSPESSYVVGETLVVDGGRSRL
jgi:NAD(P)-dependent dehydrogenase (short-subunit alcohol dehydrogenase family)